jgi:predicted nucleotide-binding protein
MFPGTNEAEKRTNNQLVQQAKAKLLAFLDALLRVPTEPVGAGRIGDVGYLPFRPYKRFKAQTFGIAEYGQHLQEAALDSGAEEAELEGVGGRRAVLDSIRRHMPTFDAAEAQTPYAPAWAKLKPILVRAGLKVDETTTLTDIKAFLDATPPPAEAPQAAPSKEAQAVPDPKRVFVIYGRNTAAYDQMVKFLRALKLDPRGFSDVSADCGANPTVLEVVRHGMEQAAGVVALFTPDEWAVLRPELNPGGATGEEARRWQARSNVLFEAGLALGIAEERTILVRLGRSVSLFSDVGGIHTVNLDNGHETRNLLRGKLRAAGCLPDMETGDHLSRTQAGDFEACVNFINEQAPGDTFLAMTPAPNRGRGKK